MQTTAKAIGPLALFLSFNASYGSLSKYGSPTRTQSSSSMSLSMRHVATSQSNRVGSTSRKAFFICVICLPPCLWHAGVSCEPPTACWISTLQLEILPAFQDFLLDLHPPAGNPCETPAASVRESNRFKRELAESQLSQRRRYPGNHDNTSTLTQNILGGFQMSLDAGLRPSKRLLPLGPPAGSQKRRQIEQKLAAHTLLKKCCANGIPKGPDRDPKSIQNL